MPQKARAIRSNGNTASPRGVGSGGLGVLFLGPPIRGALAEVYDPPSYATVPSAFKDGVALYELPEPGILLVDWKVALGAEAPNAFCSSCCVGPAICATAVKLMANNKLLITITFFI